MAKGEKSLGSISTKQEIFLPVSATKKSVPLSIKKALQSLYRVLSKGRQLSKGDQLPSNMHYRLLELSKNVTFCSPGVSQPFN